MAANNQLSTALNLQDFTSTRFLKQTLTSTTHWNRLYLNFLQLGGIWNQSLENWSSAFGKYIGIQFPNASKSRRGNWTLELNKDATERMNKNISLQEDEMNLEAESKKRKFENSELKECDEAKADEIQNTQTEQTWMDIDDDSMPQVAIDDNGIIFIFKIFIFICR